MSKKITRKRNEADAWARGEIIKIRAARQREIEKLLARDYAFDANCWKNSCKAIFDTGYINQWPESVTGKRSQTE